MKGIIIFEDFKKLINCKEILDGNYNCVISDYPEGTFGGIINRVTGARCNKDDTYDFETGALIALMKMCGVDKVVRACNEAFSEDTFKTYATKYERELNKLKKDSDKVIDELIEEIKSLKKEKEQIIVAKNILYNNLREENEKLKLDCEKLQHGYNDMIFCGGRHNGKQYKALVDLFKNVDQKKVDAAYKEAYNTTLPVWQKEALRQAYEIRKESKEKRNNKESLIWNTSQPSIRDQLDSLIEGSRAFTRKFDYEWYYKIPTKREEMWGKIFEASRYAPLEIKVAKQDITSFLRELQDKIPEVRWNGSDCPPTENIVSYWFNHDYIYFALLRNDGNGKLKLCYNDEHHSWITTKIDYIAPMRWDLFKKGRLAVKVNYYNYKEFYEACEKELGKKPATVYTEDYTVSICKKDGLFEIFTIEHQKTTGKKIVNWEDVR